MNLLERLQSVSLKLEEGDDQKTVAAACLLLIDLEFYSDQWEGLGRNGRALAIEEFKERLKDSG